MRICHVVPSLQEQHGGPSKSVRALCRALAQAGHRVDLLATAPDAPRGGREEPDIENLRVRVFHREFPDRFCLSSGLRAALGKLKPEVVHHHALWLRTLHYSHRHARRSAVPLVISPRGMMSHWAWSHHPWRKRLARVLTHPGAMSAAAGWHATSTDEHHEIQSLGFAQPVCVAPNGVEAPSADEMAAARAYWQRTCPETAARRTALFYGRFHQKKRVIELIDRWIECAPADWLLLLVGIPEDYSPETLEEYATKLGGGDRVRAFSGAGCPAPYAAAELFLLASHNENFGLTIAEAMSHGVPALVTDTTPWAMLNPAERGWCVPWSEFGTTITAATAQSAASLAERGERARAWVLREFAWNRAAELLGDFYAALAHPSR